MKNIWKGFITLLVGVALWISGSIVEGITGGLAGESFLLTRSAMNIGFFLIFFGPIFFWIILPLRDKWYKSRPKRFIVAVSPLVIFLLFVFGVIISGIFHEPQLPTYSFNTTVKGNKLIVDIHRISSGDLPDHLTLKLFNPDGEQVDFGYIPDSDLKDGIEKIELNLAYFGAPEVGNYTLVAENIRNEIIYQKEINLLLPKYSFNISTNNDKVQLTIKKIKAGSISDTLKVAFNEKDSFGSWSWLDAQEVKVSDEKTLTLKPKYGIGGFSKEYLVKVKNINGDIIFNKSIILKPKSIKLCESITKSIKLCESIIVNNIEIIPVSMTSTKLYNNLWRAEEGYRYLIVEFRCRNVGTHKSGLHTSIYFIKVILRTVEGYFYEQSTLTTFSFSLQPNEERIADLVFYIPENQKVTDIYLEIEGEERILQLQ